jgi:hypothetical protein
MINISKIALAFALAASAAASSTVFAARGDADFSLVNATGYPIRELYVSTSKSDSWGNDKLGRNVLANGSKKNLSFGDSAHCKQDMQVVFDDDESTVTWENIDLCEINKLTLKYNRSTGAVTAISE